MLYINSGLFERNNTFLLYGIIAKDFFIIDNKKMYNLYVSKKYTEQITFKKSGNYG